MTDGVTVSFPYSAAEHAAAVAETRTNRYSTRWIRFCAGTMGVLSVVMTAIGITIARSPVIEIVAQTVPLFALAAGWFLVPTGIQRYRRWSFSRRGIVDNTVQVSEFTGEGVQSSQWTHAVPWYLIERVEETPRYFVMYTAPATPSYVPKALLCDGEVETLRRIFRAAFATRQKQLRLTGGRSSA